MNSYAPFSEIEEYCLVEGKSGLFYPGTRIENISFPLTISAVRAAICSCLANDDRPVSIFQNEPVSELLDFWKHEYNIKRIDKLPDSPDLFDPLIKGDINLMATLQDLTNNCVTPHSDFPVTALLETDNGYIAGVNIEVSAWSLGLCAERTAISRAITAGYGDKLHRMHIYAPKGDFISPCGSCRQVLSDIMPSQQVILHHGNQTSSTHFVKDLLPYGFTSSSIKRKK
ncbi:cytidine deaminase [Rhodohalobacter sp.]|uniref:cytidine deaminase n=1 Tax=Rhodohalobacter sp. TaxID=1974210 RepID=UPI002ACD984E|nr:cytidine deaminase [Rhodohalobacter sp.]MDZ7757079.1 cytidine deaminase [Rhodohalobacter sp.]